VTEGREGVKFGQEKCDIFKNGPIGNRTSLISVYFFAKGLQARTLKAWTIVTCRPLANVTIASVSRCERVFCKASAQTRQRAVNTPLACRN